MEPGTERVPVGLGRRAGNLRAAAADLLDQEFAPSVGHAATVLTGCTFAPSLLTFWAVNGVLDFSVAFALGTTGGPGGLRLRLLAYALLVPVYLLVRMGYYLAHPAHRRTVLSGALPRRARTPARLASIGLGSLLFLYTNYWAAMPWLPAPAAVGLGPVAALELTPATVAGLLAVFNSLLTGPVAVALFALALDRVLSRPELASLPVVRHTLPERDPARTVLASAVAGTAFYLGLVAALTGEVGFVP